MQATVRYILFMRLSDDELYENRPPPRKRILLTYM